MVMKKLLNVHVFSTSLFFLLNISHQTLWNTQGEADRMRQCETGLAADNWRTQAPSRTANRDINMKWTFRMPRLAHGCCQPVATGPWSSRWHELSRCHEPRGVSFCLELSRCHGESSRYLAFALSWAVWVLWAFLLISASSASLLMLASSLPWAFSVPGAFSLPRTSSSPWDFCVCRTPVPFGSGVAASEPCSFHLG